MLIIHDTKEENWEARCYGDITLNKTSDEQNHRKLSNFRNVICSFTGLLLDLVLYI